MSPDVPVDDDAIHAKTYIIAHAQVQLILQQSVHGLAPRTATSTVVRGIWQTAKKSICSKEQTPALWAVSD